MQSLLILLQVLTCIALVVLILLQQGKGAEAGAAFGAGASNTMFGSSGASSFLFKLTAGLGGLFFILSLALGYEDGVIAKRGQSSLLPATVLEKQQQILPTSTKAPLVSTPQTTPVTQNGEANTP